MKLTILGSGGCMPIPKPLCKCQVCSEARAKGIPFSRKGPALFMNDINMLIDTPLEIGTSINAAGLDTIDYLMYTHLDSDHLDGYSTLVSLYFDGTEYCYAASKTISLIVPDKIGEKLLQIRGQYGSVFDAYERFKVFKRQVVSDKFRIKELTITPIFVEGNRATPYMYLFEDENQKRVLYAPCDTKPFPLENEAVYDVDILITQPGYFETGLRNGFVYPEDDYTRVELYSFDETLAIANRIRAKSIVFTHLEEYWNRSYSDYKELEKQFRNVRFAYDGMILEI
mgnify:FL=1